MMKFDEKKLAQLKTGSQHFDEKYGSVGSPSRVEFEAKAKAWYYAELLRDERRQTDMQLSTFMLIANALGMRFSLVVG